MKKYLTRSNIYGTIAIFAFLAASILDIKQSAIRQDVLENGAETAKFETEQTVKHSEKAGVRFITQKQQSEYDALTPWLIFSWLTVFVSVAGITLRSGQIVLATPKRSKYTHADYTDEFKKRP